MTAPAIETPPAAGWPQGALYWSPKGLYGFQADDISRALVLRDQGRPHALFSWATGLGKSHGLMATSAFTIEDQAADVVLLVCEKIKLKEWLEDFQRFTRFETRIHHGPARKGKVAKLGFPTVLVSTYETFATDLAAFEENKGGRGRHATNGWLLGALVDSGLKPMVIFDESDKLSNRKSRLYKSWDHVLRNLRKLYPQMPTYMASATPIRRDLEGAFNQLRLMAPKAMPKVGEFEKYFLRGRDIYGRPQYFDHRIPEFVALAAPLLLTKSKEDEDVRDQFPKLTEEALWTDLEGPQKELYDFVAELDDPGGLTALRQICAHPAALIHSALHGESKLAKMLYTELGEDYLRALPSAKTERLADYIRPIVLNERAKAVAFSFFGPSTIPLLKTALEAKGVQVWVHNEDHGIQAFRTSKEPGVLLCSDAASRGINIPEAEHLIEYDIASTYGTRTQRINRASRIGQGGPTLTVRTMLVRKSVEVGLLYAMLRGHGQSDALLGVGVTGEEFMTEPMRRRILTLGMND
jgi:superfamily II DNA or RNA helicase